jgi:hypothetical protein
VELDRALAHAERGGDLLVAASAREELKDTGLARGERDLVGRGRATATARRHVLEHARRDDGL